MKLTIFGASGGTGKQLVEQALARGDEVIAFVRNPLKIAIGHPHLKIAAGELTDAEAVARAIAGSNAVLSALGPKMGRGPSSKPITMGILNILAAMKRHSVQRLVLSWGPSIPSPNDNLTLPFKLLYALVKLTSKSAYLESSDVNVALHSSDRDWTIVRVMAPNNKPKTGNIRIGYLGKGQVGIKISRADLAEFMLEQIEDAKFVRQAPVISN
jgi:putative NADH-flavin reductase